MTQELDLERELLQELEKLDSIFVHDNEDSQHVYTPSRTGRLSRDSLGTLSAYELAAAESEKEELQDKLRVLLSKTEDFDQQLRNLTTENFALRSANEHLYYENEQLKLSPTDYDHSHQQNLAGDGAESIDIEEFRLLEFKLAETRSKLAKSQQLYEDLYMAKEQALRELDQERLTRIHAEKERDAYSAAYEAALQHFERWTKTKVKS
jgi:hypothetical protein